jgi:hypothetical protein
VREGGRKLMQNVFKNAPSQVAQQGPDGPLFLLSH